MNDLNTVIFRDSCFVVPVITPDPLVPHNEVSSLVTVLSCLPELLIGV